MRRRRVPDPDVVGLLVTGTASLSLDVPIAPSTRELAWRDSVLPPKTREQIRQIESWVKRHPAPRGEQGVRKGAKACHRVLFHGAAGSGKTMTATLIGKTTGRRCCGSTSRV